MTKYFGELSLSPQQEIWIKEWLYKWGAWIRSGRLDRRQVNIIGRLMQSVLPSEDDESICTDEEGLLISFVVDQFFSKMDKELHFIVYGYYVNTMTTHRITTILFDEIQPTLMRGSARKKNNRKPSHRTVNRYVKQRLELATAILYELLVKAFAVEKVGKIIVR